MNRSKLQADQLCKWSDTHALTTACTDFCRVAPPPPTAIAPPSAARSPHYQSQASECLANYHRLREILDEVCAINHELLCRREGL